MSDKPIKLTATEFEMLLFKMYTEGFALGVSPNPGKLKENFDNLMYKLKLKTKK